MLSGSCLAQGAVASAISAKAIWSSSIDEASAATAGGRKWRSAAGMCSSSQARAKHHRSGAWGVARTSSRHRTGFPPSVQPTTQPSPLSLPSVTSLSRRPSQRGEQRQRSVCAVSQRG
eukprot:scaffold244878_cov37-Tisochrysis_lutea.AAC.1